MPSNAKLHQAKLFLLDAQREIEAEPLPAVRLHAHREMAVMEIKQAQMHIDLAVRNLEKLRKGGSGK